MYSGKDTLAGVLLEKLPGYRTLVPLARRLKVLVADLRDYGPIGAADRFNRISVDATGQNICLEIKEVLKEAFLRFPDEIAPEFDGKPRQILQYLGRKVREQTWESIWIDLALFDIHNENAHGGICIVTDMRYDNEYDELKGRGFYLVRINIDRGLQGNRYEQFTLRSLGSAAERKRWGLIRSDPSELQCAVGHYDKIINASENIADFEKAAEEIVKDLYPS